MTIIGHQKIWQFLKKSVEVDKLSHAYLFAGQEKLGKKTLALEWVSFLFGNSVPNQVFNGKEHPDLTFITAATKEIQISQIRDLIWKLSLKPSLGPLKVAIIDNAHLMNQEAQTSLLKTLEEPRGNTLLILISDKRQYLFPTILSRVQTIKFNSVKKEEIEKYLSGRGIPKKEIEKISDIALGRPGVALDLISGREKLENFSQRINELKKISNSPLYFRFQYVKNLVKEDKSSFPPSLLPHKSSVAEDLENIKDVLDVWLNYLRSILLSRFSPSSRAIAKGEEENLFSSPFDEAKASVVEEGFAKYPTIKIKNIINHIQTTKFLLSSTNVNPRLALETLMIELN